VASAKYAESQAGRQQAKELGLLGAFYCLLADLCVCFQSYLAPGTSAAKCLSCSRSGWYRAYGAVWSVITIERLHVFLKIAVKGAGQIVVIKARYGI